MQLQNNQDIQALARKKRIKISNEDIKAIVSKIYSLNAYNDFTAKVTQHSNYVGEDKKAATSLKGFVIQFNKFIKKLFGCVVDEITNGRDLELLALLRNKAVDVIAKGESENLTRKEIKQKMYNRLESIFRVVRSQDE